jgi:hypothetical protein
MSDMRNQAFAKARQSKSMSGSDAYSSYWKKWVSSFDFLDPEMNLRKIFGDYYTPVRWHSKNPILRVLVSLEIFVTNLLSSPKYYFAALARPSYWKLSQTSRRQKRHMNFANIIALSAFNLICSKAKPKNQIICIIGDGASNFVSLCLSAPEQFKKIISINLPEVHLVELEMILRSGVAESDLMLVDSKAGASEFFDSDSKVAIVSAEDVKCLLGLKIDVFVNMSSMQEMTKEAISEYFDLISGNGSLFYCCNREEKKLPDGTIIRFDEYPWGPAKFLIKEVCPWMRKTMNLTRPFIRRQEVHVHALAKFTK